MKYLLNATIGKKKLRKKILRKLNNGNIDSIRSLNIFIERLHQFVGSGFSARSGRLCPSNRSVARRLSCLQWWLLREAGKYKLIFRCQYSSIMK